MSRPAPASRSALPRLVALKSGLVSVRFRGAVVLARVSPAAAAAFIAEWDGSAGRAAYPAVAGVSHSARCRAYRARLAAASAAPASAPVVAAPPAPVAPAPAASAPARPSILARVAAPVLALARRLFRPAAPARRFRASCPGRPAAPPPPAGGPALFGLPV